MLHWYYLYAYKFHIYFRGAFAFINTNTSAAMLGMTTWHVKWCYKCQQAFLALLLGKVD
jgi:hypothetical protein